MFLFVVYGNETVKNESKAHVLRTTTDIHQHEQRYHNTVSPHHQTTSLLPAYSPSTSKVSPRGTVHIYESWQFLLLCAL